ncbi:protein of unknown function [Cyanobium sp. NIES-981]|nr:protein of unknown function [Cyanobium sp. NIES-981]
MCANTKKARRLAGLEFRTGDRSVGLDVPAVGLLELGPQLAPVDALGGGGGGHRLVDAGFHAPQTAHVHVGLGIFDHREDLLGVLQHPVLNVHAAALGVLLLAADRLGVAEVVGELALVVLEVGVVQQIRGGGHAHDEPGLAAEGPAVRLALGGLEHAAQVGPHRGDAGAGGQHDHVGLLIVGQEHLLAHRAGDLHLGAGFDVAQEGGAHAVDGLAVLLVLELPHAQRHGVAAHVVAVTGAGDRIEAELVGLAVGVGAIRNDADALALHVVELGITTGQVEGDVIHPADRPLGQQAVVLGDGSDERILGLVEVDRNGGVGHGGWFRWSGGGWGRSGLGWGLRGGGSFRQRPGDLHGRDATALAGDGLHRALELGEGNGEATLSLTLAADPEGFDHHSDHAAVGLRSAAR